MQLVSQYIDGFLLLFYPKICLACGSSISGNEDILCTYCRLSLPETGYHKSDNNPIEQIFWGRIPVVSASSFLFFEKGSKYRHLLHEFKYKGKKEIGTALGKLMGSALLNTRFAEVDIIVPVPLHPAKLRRRGFNQSEIIAEGVAAILNKPLINNAVTRRFFSSSQTIKSRFERWENVKGIFKVITPESIANKHVLIIDDVITTGATIEAVGNAIITVHDTKISVLTLAYAL